MIILIFISSLINGQNCTFNEITLELTTGDWASELSWSITDTNGTLIDTCNQLYQDHTLYTDTFCLENGCYNFNMYDSYGDGWQGGNYQLFDSLANLISNGDLQGSYFFGSVVFSVNGNCAVIGCTCPSATNFNSNAAIDDTSCQFISDNIALLSNWQDNSLPQNVFNGSYNEVYGFAINGGEYAVIGSTMGTHIIDITDPANPNEVVMVDGAFQGTGVTHRDFHVLENYLYAVCDQGASTLQIINLSDLPNSISIAYDSDSLFNIAHNIFIDTTAKKLYACDVAGTNNSNTWDSPLMVFDISNPTQPTLLHDMSGFINNTHDIWVENDTAYINIPSTGLVIYDFSSIPLSIGSLTSYPDQGTNHSGWKKNDLYIFADENHGYDLKLVNTSSLGNLTISSLINSDVDPSSIAHNIIIKEQFAFISYYHDGLQVFDISNPSNPLKIGYYDTYLPDHHNGYAGCWGVYPLLPSGNILISDIQSGLFVLKLIHNEITICESDSILLNGSPIYAEGYYYDFPVDSLGYTTVDITELSYYHPLSNYFTVSIADGDSVFLEGNYQTQAGVYVDSLISSWGCDSIVITTLNIETGVSISNYSKKTATIYPNPSTHLINIESAYLGEVILYDLLGNSIASYFKQSNKLVIPVHSLSNGIYLLQIKNETYKLEVNN